MPVTTIATTTTISASEERFEQFKIKLNIVALVLIIMATLLTTVILCNIFLWSLRMKKLKNKKDLESQLNEIKSKSDKAATTEKPNTSVSISVEK
ncbi:hypothetical protein XELAEV_18031603mg [Xenopus laevis]|uniref:Uncharacterized protein n=1 Tax=Xenopus laevis TaxID=8355 RepID=A0A974CN26_XENLA|nr:hypothetical protein XELAEV_18031603mg [Xenopus laevis]